MVTDMLPAWYSSADVARCVCRALADTFPEQPYVVAVGQKPRAWTVMLHPAEHAVEFTAHGTAGRPVGIVTVPYLEEERRFAMWTDLEFTAQIAAAGERALEYLAIAKAAKIRKKSEV